LKEREREREAGHIKCDILSGKRQRRAKALSLKSFQRCCAGNDNNNSNNNNNNNKIESGLTLIDD